jgi:hypothetical protein
MKIKNKLKTILSHNYLKENIKKRNIRRFYKKIMKK